jgi:tetratricopeptide (TPR) repeat protein
MAFCSKCGVVLNDGVKFCSNCGTPVVSLDGPASANNPSEDARKLRLEAMNATNSGNFDNAISLLIQALKLRPDYIDAHDNLGTTYMRKGDFQKALDTYHQTIKIAPDFASPYWGCGLVYAKMKEWNNAVLNHTQAISIAEKYPNLYDNSLKVAMCYNSRGVAYLNLEDFLHALSDFEKAFSLSPGRQDYKKNIETAKTWLAK